MHVAEILAGGAQQRRPADVDLLDQLVERRLGVLRRLGERIEVDDDEIDQLDPLRPDRLEIVGTVAAREDAAVDLRVQRLDPAVHHLGKAGDVRDVGDRQPGLGDGLRRSAGRDELDAAGGEPAREVDQPGLVRNTQNCAHIWRFS